MLEHALVNFAEEINEDVKGVVSFIDAGGIGVDSFKPSHISVLKQMTDENAQNFPEFVGKIIVFNLPWIFPKAWKVAKMVLDPITVAKIEIYSTIPKEKLRLLFDTELLPKVG